jgi:hypothetical protein
MKAGVVDVEGRATGVVALLVDQGGAYIGIGIDCPLDIGDIPDLVVDGVAEVVTPADC